MPEEIFLKQAFDAERKYLCGVAYRMLGNVSDAEDAVQEAWIRLNGAAGQAISNPRAWLTTVVGRICFDLLRARRSRHEESFDVSAAENWPDEKASAEDEAALVDAVGLALLIALERLNPDERLAFVLHDVFGVPFDAIAPMLDRSPIAARQVASRARRKVRGEHAMSDSSLDRRKHVIAAFLAAAREGDFAALIALLDPDVELEIDPKLQRPGMPAQIKGAEAVGKQALLGKRRRAQLALINEEVGIVVASGARLGLALAFFLRDDKISRITLTADPGRLRALNISVLDPVEVVADRADGFSGSRR